LRIGWERLVDRGEGDFSEFPSDPINPERAQNTENTRAQVDKDQLVVKAEVQAESEKQQAHQEPKLRNSGVNRIG
jgi:hypothetical protein